MKVIGLSILLLSAIASPGYACMNGVTLRPRAPIDRRDLASEYANEADIRLVATAEMALDAGNPITALRLLDQSEAVSLRQHKAYLDIGHPEALDSLRPDPRINTQARSLRLRFERVVAVAVMRARPAQATMSLYLLQSQLKLDPQSPVLRARVAEALVLLERKPQARSMLEELAKADLMPDAEARKQLFRLRNPRAKRPAA
jgi:hypothetical protein